MIKADFAPNVMPTSNLGAVEAAPEDKHPVAGNSLFAIPITTLIRFVKFLSIAYFPYIEKMEKAAQQYEIIQLLSMWRALLSVIKHGFVPQVHAARSIL